MKWEIYTPLRALLLYPESLESIPMKDSVKSALITDDTIQYPTERSGKNDIGLVEEKRSLQQKTRWWGMIEFY